MLIYNLLGYSSTYSGRTSSLWFYSKDESINFNGDIAGGNNFKCLSHKAKVLTNIVADGDHRTQEMQPLKYLSIFWGSLEMIN